MLRVPFCTPISPHDSLNWTQILMGLIHLCGRKSPQLGDLWCKIGMQTNALLHAYFTAKVIQSGADFDGLNIPSFGTNEGILSPQYTILSR